MIESSVGTPVVDSHAHFFTYDMLKEWLSDPERVERMQQRVKYQTDMSPLELPDEPWDIGAMWIDELDKYGIEAIGMMISPNTWDEFLETRKRFPGRFMGYANIDPSEENAVELIRKAGKDDFQGIKLYPSTWDFHTYDEICYPVYEEAAKHDLLVILHFGITIGPTANLRYGNPLDIQKPAQDFPELNFMIAHFGAGFFRECLMLLYQVPNVVMDSSGSNSWMKYQPYDLDLEKIFERALVAGASCRTVFGTDSSFFPRGFRIDILEKQYQAVDSLREKLNLTQEDIDLIFHDNILRLTGFEPNI
jgi:uncharacterized protein